MSSEINLKHMKNLFVLLVLLVQFAFYTKAQTIVQWRGTDRNGVYNEKNLLKSWPAEGPNSNIFLTRGLIMGCFTSGMVKH